MAERVVDLSPVHALVPTRRNIHIRAIQCANGGTAKQFESALQVSAQNFKCAGDACLTSGGQTICIGASAEDGAGSEAESLGDVGAATNASIHQNFRLTVHGVYHFWQDTQRSR